MKPMQSRPSNDLRLRQVRGAIDALVAEMLRRGFHGKGRVELVVQDGVIQEVRRVVEQIVRETAP